MPHILALVPYPPGRAPGQRYRIEQWAPLLEKEGLQVHLSAFLPVWGMEALYQRGHFFTKSAATLLGCARRLKQIPSFGRYDALFVYREAMLLGPDWLERLAASRRPLVFDFDDATFLGDVSAANRWAGRLRPRGKAASLCRVAAHVTVGNETLADFARRHARLVTVIPSTIDTTAYVPRPRPANPRPVVGWTGSTTTVRYLEALHPVLVELRRVIDFEMLVVGVPVDLPGIEVRYVPWNADTEPDDLRPVDVGVMPLTDDEWSRGKSGMKALQYMALGIPPVVSPVGVNARIVADGKNGFHARDNEEWVRKLQLLLREPELRRRLGEQGRRTVEQEYSAIVQVPRVADVLRRSILRASYGPEGSIER